MDLGQLDLNGHQSKLAVPNHQGDTQSLANEPLSASVLFIFLFFFYIFSTSSVAIELFPSLLFSCHLYILLMSGSTQHAF